MSEAGVLDIDAILAEFAPIRISIAQPSGLDTIDTNRPGNDMPDWFHMMVLAHTSEEMLQAPHGFPDIGKYAWIKDASRYSNSFEMWCQGAIVHQLIGLWRHGEYRFAKPVIARNLHTGSYHIEIYETASAFFACLSYQFVNILNQFALLNHFLIELGGQPTERLQPIGTNDVGGHAIGHALRTRWNEACPYLDAFIDTLDAAKHYRGANVALKEHVSAAGAQFDRYDEIRKARAEMSGAQVSIPPEAVWTLYADNVLQFCIAHELAHARSGDVQKGKRSSEIERRADLLAAVATTRLNFDLTMRHGHVPSASNIIVGPVVFFVLSRIFSYFESLDLSNPNSHIEEAMREELELQSRAMNVAGFLSAGEVMNEIDAAPFWVIYSELRLIEMAVRRRVFERAGMKLGVPIEFEMRQLQRTEILLRQWTARMVVEARERRRG